MIRAENPGLVGEKILGQSQSPLDVPATGRPVRDFMTKGQDIGMIRADRLRHVGQQLPEQPQGRYVVPAARGKDRDVFAGFRM